MWYHSDQCKLYQAVTNPTSGDKVTDTNREVNTTLVSSLGNSLGASGALNCQRTPTTRDGIPRNVMEYSHKTPSRCQLTSSGTKRTVQLDGLDRTKDWC